MLPKRFLVNCAKSSTEQDEVMNFYGCKNDPDWIYKGFSNWEFIEVGCDNNEGLQIHHKTEDAKSPLSVFTFSEWKELISFPKKWYVCPETEKNLSLIKKYLNKFKNHTITFKDNAYDCKGNYYSHETHVSSDYTKITMEQFKKHIMKIQPKEVTGYKLLKELPDLEAGTLFTWYKKNDCWSHSEEDNAYWYQDEEIKNLPLWFEPVYKSKEVVIELGTPLRKFTISKNLIVMMDGDDQKREFTQTDVDNIRKLFSTKEFKTFSYYPKEIQFGCSSGTSLTEEDVITLQTKQAEL